MVTMTGVPGQPGSDGKGAAGPGSVTAPPAARGPASVSPPGRVGVATDGRRRDLQLARPGPGVRSLGYESEGQPRRGGKVRRSDDATRLGHDAGVACHSS